MFGTTLIIIGTVMHLYVFWRIWSVPLLRQRLPWPVLPGVCVALWVVFYLGRAYGHGTEGAAARILEWLGMNWLATVFLVSICVLPVDVLTAFGFLLRRFAPLLRELALAAGGLLAAIALFQGLRSPVVTRYDVYLAGLPQELDGVVLVGMSDLHIGSLLDRRWLAARVRQVQAESPDLICLLGDIFEGHGGQRDELVTPLRHLSAPLGVWAVHGNHEGHGGRGGNAMMEEAGLTVLRDRCVEVRPGLVLAGVDDLTSGRRSGRRSAAVSETLSGRPSGATILLSHTPWQTEDAARAGVGLMLCGHTHAGQVWPFGYLVRRVYPLLAGPYQVDGMTVIVSRGAGTWGPRMRLWSPGEIVRVTLHASPEGTVSSQVGGGPTDGRVP